MVSDYFEDISPDEPERADAGSQRVPIHPADDQARGIRNIAPPRPRPRVDGNMRDMPPVLHRRRRAPRWWLWGIAAAAVIALVALVFVATRPTTVTVTPKSHPVVFTDAMQFVAYPAANAATGTLTYTVQTVDLQDSKTVASTGSTTTPPTKASGSITVYNAYSTKSVHLIKNTRFETPGGLIFRAPDAITIPGMQGTAPGQMQVTVFADAPGEQYNVGPVSHFSVPGLKSSPSMYPKIYAASSAAMSGGSSGGTAPAVDQATLASARASMQADLSSKVRATAEEAASSSGFVIPSLVQVSFAPEPTTAGSSGDAVLHEQAHLIIPVFPAAKLAQQVAQLTTANAQGAAVTLRPGTGFGAVVSNPGAVLGTDPLNFSLKGQGTLVWDIDTKALAAALAGRNSGAFETVVSGFPGVAEAHSRIEPFWSSSFPSDSASIHIVVSAPITQ